MKENRLYYIDFLKFIGLTGIIIAHVGSPNWLMQLRSFDVPLMVILSSILAQESIKKYNDDIKSMIKYYTSRIKRLVIPTWIFLTFYFILKFILTNEFIGIKYYLLTFLLTRYGFGYVWIILIYLYSAFLIPIFKNIGYSKINTIIIIFIYILYEISYFFQIGIDYKIIETTLYYIIPYGLLTYIGYNFNNISDKEKKIYIFTNLILFVLMMYFYYLKTGSFQLVQIAKYPPRLYYLTYGLLCSFILLIVCKKYNKLFNNKLINFISKNSMWIYLWHILVLDIYKYIHLPEIWYLKLLIVYSISLLIVLLVNKILCILESKHKINFFKYLRG